MKKHTPASSTAGLGLGLAALALILSSCASSNHAAIDYRNYEKTPDKVSSKVWRGLAKSNPLTAKAAFHGRWGGSGNEGGEPVDAMDEGFRRHDIVYTESHCGKSLKAADRELVEWLERLDEETLNEKQLKYRNRAIGFMSSPWANFVGKPPGVMLRKKEKDDCFFASVEVVESFFDPDHPGFPDAQATLEMAAAKAADVPRQTIDEAPVLAASSPAREEQAELLAGR